jgi:hypothetical protein
LNIKMQEGEGLGLEQIQEFLEASQDLQFEGKERQQIYEWVTSILRQHRYGQHGRAAKGLLRRYLVKMDRDEPGADDTSDCAVWRGRPGQDSRLPATSLCE